MKAGQSVVRKTVCGVLVAWVSSIGAGCGDSSLAPPSSSLPLSFSLVLAGGPEAAFDQADGLRLRLERNGQTVLDTLLGFDSGGGDVRLRLRVDRELEGEPLLLRAELLSGSAPLFAGTAQVTPGANAAGPVDIVLQPVVAGIVPPSSTTITSIGATLPIAAAVVFATGDTIPGLQVEYSLLDSGIIRLLAGGIAEAIAEGSARVEARFGTFSVRFEVLVRPAVASVEVAPATALIAVGRTTRYTARPLDDAGRVLTARTVTWSSSNPAVLTVDATGLARGVAEGTADIRAEVEGVTGSARATVTLTPPPAAPGGLAAAVAGTTVTLTWADVATDETSYRVDRGSPGVALAEVATLPANTTSYIDAGVPENQLFTYVVRACNAGGCSDSDVITVGTLPAAPAGLVVVAVDTAAAMFRIQWQDASLTETRFEIQSFDPSRQQWSIRAVVPENATTYEGPGSPGLTESLRVVACNEAGCSAPTNVVTVTLPLNAPIVNTLDSPTGTELAGSVDGHGAPYDFWFEYDYDPSFGGEPSSTYPIISSTSGLWYEPLYDLYPGEVVYYRAVATNSSGTTIGAILSLKAPDLQGVSASTTQVCNSTGCSNPTSVTFTATSSGPSGLHADPFSVVEFDIGFPFYNSLGSGSVTVTDDGTTRTNTYSFTWTPAGFPLGTYDVVARGYPSSQSGNVVTSWVSIMVTPN